MLRIMGVALAAVMLLASPAVVPAKKKGKKKPGPVVTATATVAAAASQNPTATATCPAGTTVVGGGYAATPFTTGGSNFVFESRRAGNRAWTVRSHNASAVAGSLTAEAYCRRNAPGLTEASGASILPAGGLSFPEGAASATCPKGRSAFAGGFVASIDELSAGFGGPYVFASTRSAARVWSISAINTDGDPRSLTALAYCAKGSAPAVISQVVDVTGVGTPAAAVTPACPKVKVKNKSKTKKKKAKRRRTSPVAGGFVTPAPDVGLGPATSHGVFTLESRLSGAAWRASGNSIGTEPGASRIQATAVCG